MDSLPATALIAACTGFVILAFCLLTVSILATRATTTRSDSPLWRTCKSEVYQDEDGEANPDVDAPSPVLSAQLLALLLAGAALGAVFVRGFYRDFDVESTLLLVGWLMLGVMTVSFTFEKNPNTRYTTGSAVSASSTVFSFALLADIFSDPLSSSSSSASSQPAWDYTCSTGLQMLSGLCLAWLCVSVPRRPPVYFQGTLVDGQFTCSMLQRLTFSWINELLSRARTGTTLEYHDLPALDKQSRSQTLEADFPALPDAQNGAQPRALWRVVLGAHWREFAWQWSLSVLESVFQMVPPICLYKILELLEARDANVGARTDRVLWFWVVGLGASKLIHIVLDALCEYLGVGDIGIKVRSQLSALTYAKALRMKIIDGGVGSQGGSSSSTKKTGEAAESKTAETFPESGVAEATVTETTPLLASESDKKPASTDSSSKPEDAKDTEKNAEKNEQDEDEGNAVARGVVNLLGIDMLRIQIAAGWNFDLVRAAAKLALSVAFLVKLLGWWSTLAALSIPVLFQPLTQYSTSQASKASMRQAAARDTNAHKITEALHGIRQIRFSATEPQWEAQILASRERVLATQWERSLWAVYLMFVWFAIPVLMCAAALTIFALQSGGMSAAIAFTALSVLSSLEWTIGVLPMTITEQVDGRVSSRRVEEHLRAEEQKVEFRVGDGVRFQGATVTWPSSAERPQFALSGLDLDFPQGELSVIYGKTGTGKTLLLAAIIGEADITSGEVTLPEPPLSYTPKDAVIAPEDWIVPNARAYVGQVPWIENASVKDCILYGLPFDATRYHDVIHACALEPDLAIFPDGEDTEIGATGINLSGGQKWRLTLARALYSRAGILVLDDIFSAVDAHVGRHLLQHAVVGKLGAGRTRILVTHHLGLVEPSASHVVILENGTATPSDGSSKNAANLADKEESFSRSIEKEALTPAEDLSLDGKDVIKAAPRKFVEDETRAVGRVKGSVYMAYMLASGSVLRWVGTLGLFAITSVLTIYRTYWLALWTKSYTMEAANPGPTQRITVLGTSSSISTAAAAAAAAVDQPNLGFYLGIYVALAFVGISVSGLRTLAVVLGNLRASRALFEQMTRSVLRAKLRWLDVEPTGRILNRFVADFTLIDGRMGMDIMFMGDCVFALLAIGAAALFVSAWMLVPMALLLLAGVYVVRQYLDGARDVKRLESNSKSPMFELATSSLSGLATIRCFGRVDAYMQAMYEHIDRLAKTTYYTAVARYWMRVRQGGLGILLTIAIAVLVSFLPGIDGALAGFALSFALNFSVVAERMISTYTMLELEMNCTERVVEYTQLDTESEDGDDAAAAWPSEGRIEVDGLEVGYAPDLPSVLQGLSFSVAARQRIGIVGRTGSGKSSFTLALFRMLEARKGRIVIDGVDIASLKLAHLRSRLAIIPQDPVLFSGTLRSNLDPFDDHDDAVLFDALRRVHLLESSNTLLLAASSSSSPSPSVRPAGGDEVYNIFTNLSSPIARGGANLSQGQKQLLCLARAILARPKVLVLDEATSAVDMATDALIQRSIREDFGDATLLVVAHRLSTVADFDRVLVLSEGRVAEYDEPRVLARREGGAFRKMVDDSGETEALAGLFAEGAG